MKLWISKYETPFVQGPVYVIHLTDPVWDNDWMGWESSASATDIEEEELHAVGFRAPLENAECAEYDVSGRKPKHICTWLPNEDSDD